MKNVRLLIADDNPQFLQFLSNLLSDDACTVGTVSGGNALIAAALALSPHIIISDIPTITGLAAVRQLEAVAPDIKVVVLTDHDEPEFMAAALTAGASAVLIKKRASDLCGKIRVIIRDLLAGHPKQFTETARAYGNNYASFESGMA